MKTTIKMTYLSTYFLMLVSLLTINFSCKNAESVIAEEAKSPSDWVYPYLDSANSRWFFFASACRPFGMVTLNPDTQLGGAWGSGYRYDTDTIKGFSHIHGWQIAGVSVMPVIYENNINTIMEDYYSSFAHDNEVAEVGYHEVVLDRYGINARLTSTTRVGFHHYTFPSEKSKGVIFQLAGPLGPSDIKSGSLIKVDDNTLHGTITNAPTKRRPKDFKVFFTVKFDQNIQALEINGKKNALVAFANDIDEIKMKVGLSYTSHDNARINLQSELPHWDFDKVVQESKEEWDELLGRVKVHDGDTTQTKRFYTDLWHALQGRRIISDYNGAYPDNTGENFRIGQLPVDASGSPLFNHYNSDSFWGAQWTINTLWGLLYPDIYSEFVKSLMVYYRDGGLVPRGPSGGNYTFVMTGSSSTPFIVSAFQKGIDIGDAEEVYTAVKKNHLSRGIMSKAGYEHTTFLGGGLDHYIDKGYVPYPIPEGDFGYHQDGASLTLEYAYQDYTLAQMAKALGQDEDYQQFIERSKNYQNVYDPSSGWMRPKNINGEWKEPFDPYQYENGFNECNAAQGTWFVGHDINNLEQLMGGKKKAIDKLNKQFEEAAKTNFTAGNSHERGEDPTRARIPINYGNQPSMQTAFIFQELGRADLTQYWKSAIMDKTFGGLSPHTGYSGDEDQGLMGSLASLIKLGFFQMDGGTQANPEYALSTPLFDKVTLTLANDNSLTIEKKGKGIYIDHILYNAKKLGGLKINHSQLQEGGTLKYVMREK